MKIVLTDAQTVLDDIVNADVLNRFGEVESFGLLKCRYRCVQQNSA